MNVAHCGYSAVRLTLRLLQEAIEAIDRSFVGFVDRAICTRPRADRRYS